MTYSASQVVKSFTRSSCAKCILSGEHSVLLGAKAISIPVPLMLKSRVLYTKDNFYRVQFIGANADEQVFTREELESFKFEKERLYLSFTEGNLGIENVMPNRFDLVNLTLAYLVDYMDITHGITLQLSSSIPWGVGLGSSAALVTSVLQHTCAQRDRVLSLATQLEHYAHGRSSGLDPATCLSKKVVIKKDCTIEYRELDNKFWSHFTLIDTGRPLSGTGECVSHSYKFLSENPEILADFDTLSSNIALDITNGNYLSLANKINQNQKLLETIGVVPNKVQSFLSSLVEQGGCGKICGSGSIKGDNGGLLLVDGDNAVINSLCEEYNYRIIYSARTQLHVDS